MAEIVQQVNELANLQNRSESLIALAVQNAEIRANIGRKISEMREQFQALAGVLASAKSVANRVEGANAKQTEHLDKLARALESAPTSTDLERSVGELSAVVQGLGGQPPGAPTGSMETAAVIEDNMSTELPFKDAISSGGYRYSRKRKTPTRKKTSSRRRRKHKTRRR
jgi:hypothetical protein